jgi:AraC-like DNA-binding protein
VPGTGYLVPKNDLIRWHNPLTPRGVSLHDFDGWARRLEIHECGYLPRGCSWNFDAVCSPFWRLYCNGRAGSYVEIDGRRIALAPRRVMLIPANTTFHCRGIAGVPHLWIHFSLPATFRFVSPRACLPSHPALNANLNQVRRWFHEAKRHPTDVEKRKLFHACSALLHSCLARASLQEQRVPPRLRAMLEWIESSLAAPLSNSILSRQAHMSVEGFLRWFRSHQGITPARYVARRRIEKACRLLTLTSQSIEEISEGVGFANRHHFTRVFRLYTGEGPARFRRAQSPEGF